MKRFAARILAVTALLFAALALPGPSRATAETYANSKSVTNNGVTFTVQWNNPVAGQDTTFHVTQSGGSDAAKARMDVPTYYDSDGSGAESVCDPSRSAWSSYYTLGSDGYDFTFNFTASGRYYMLFYYMDTTSAVYYARSNFFVTIDDAAHPAVSTIVANAVAQAQSETDGSEYSMALWLHDWELKQLDYDHSLNYCSAESGLTRGKGTCESFQRIYQKLLTKAGLENARMTGNGHTWNAVKIDGKWCQVDVNWDDDDGANTNAYGFDATHLYFGLTDELMAKAHSDHAATYQADGYAYRSTDLSNSYFVRNGQAAAWAKAYQSRVQAQLDAKAQTFSIGSDNASLPPSINGIQNGIVAYALNQMSWTAADGTKAVSFEAVSNVTTISSTKWTAAYDFTVAYEEKQAQKVDVSGAKVTAASQTYTGAALTPAVTVTLDGAVLDSSCYTVVYSGNVNAGTATVTVTGAGDCTGTATGTFKIAAADIDSATFGSIATQTYSGSALTPGVSATFGGKTLTAGIDFTVAYADNTAAGTATAAVAGKGNFTGSKTLRFVIDKADISDATVSVANQTYTGSALTPAPTVKLDGVTLKSGSDYTIGYSNNTNAGTATITVTGAGNYKGTVTGTFKIGQASISGATVKAADQTYTGSELKPAVTVTLNGRTLAKGTDYTVAYKNNIGAGTATVTVTGTGNYKGSKTADFAIGKADLSGAKASAIAQLTYTGTALKPTPTLTFNGIALKEGTDYTVGYSNNTSAGTASVTCTASDSGNFSGSKSVSFAIAAASIEKASVKAADQTYTGSALSEEGSVSRMGAPLTPASEAAASASGKFWPLARMTVPPVAQPPLSVRRPMVS